MAALLLKTIVWSGVTDGRPMHGLLGPSTMDNNRGVVHEAVRRPRRPVPRCEGNTVRHGTRSIIGSGSIV